jgi:uncharacterized membrane protein
MDVSSGFLAVGAVMVVAGAIMVYMSLRAGPSEVRSGGAAVIFIGPIPIVVGGSRKWVVAALGAAAVILLVMIMRSAQPDLIGW